MNRKYSIIFYFYLCTRENFFLSTQNTQQYFTIYIIPRKKTFCLVIQNTQSYYSFIYTQEKKFLFYQQKILINISLFILYPEKKNFF